MAEEYFLEDFKNLVENMRTHVASNNMRAANAASRSLVDAYKAIGVEKDDAIKYIRGAMQDGQPRFPQGFKFPDPVDNNPFRGTEDPLEDKPRTKATETKPTKVEPEKKAPGRALSPDEVRQRLAARGKGLAAPATEVADEKPKAADKPAAKKGTHPAIKSITFTPESKAAAAVADVVDTPLEPGKPAGYKEDLERKLRNLERIQDRFPKVKENVARMRAELDELNAKEGGKPKKAAKVAQAVADVAPEKTNFSGIMERAAKGEVKLSGVADAEFRPTQKVDANVPSPAAEQTRSVLSADRAEPPRPTSGGLQGESRGNPIKEAAQELDGLVKKYGSKAISTVLKGAMTAARAANPAMVAAGPIMDASPAGEGHDAEFQQHLKDLEFKRNQAMAAALKGQRDIPDPSMEEQPKAAETMMPAAAAARGPAKEPPMRNYSSYEVEAEIKQDPVARAAFIGQVSLPANANLGDVIQFARLSGMESFQWGDQMYEKDGNSPTGFKVKQ
jgi:hypothetical protein